MWGQAGCFVFLFLWGEHSGGQVPPEHKSIFFHCEDRPQSSCEDKLQDAAAAAVKATVTAADWEIHQSNPEQTKEDLQLEPCTEKNHTLAHFISLELIICLTELKISPKQASGLSLGPGRVNLGLRLKLDSGLNFRPACSKEGISKSI